MKTEEEIKKALAHHSLRMSTMGSIEKEAIAKQLHWSLDYMAGYQEGVKWAYEWILGKK